MPGFERTQQAADLFAKLICCANPECRQESDQLQTLGTACKHAFCWDCINFYSHSDTFVVCPMCACPLEVHRPKAAQIFNNLAQHINEFKLLLREYERALKSEGIAAAATIEQTQKLFQSHEEYAAEKNDRAARTVAINEFISSQIFPLAKDNGDDGECLSDSDFSEELNITPPPQSRCQVMETEHVEEELSTTPPPQLRCEVMEAKHVEEHNASVETAGSFDDFSNEEITAAATGSGALTDSIPQFGQPVMSSTQQTNLFPSQAVHARIDIFEKEANQEIKTYRYGKMFNYFHTKPRNTFDARVRKTGKAPWMDLSDKKRGSAGGNSVKMECDNSISTMSAHQESCATPRRGPKIEYPCSRTPKSSFSTPKTPCINDPVIAAVVGGKLQDVQDAIDAGYDVNLRDDKKRTPLFIAVEMERQDICQLLVERGGSVINASCGSDCNTALHVAVSRGNEGIVRYLLSKGASKTIRNIRQETPSQLAQPHSPLRLLVEKYRAHPRQPLVARLPDVYVVCCAREIWRTLSYQDRSVLTKVVTVVEYCDEAATHYVVSTDNDGVANIDADFLRAMMQNTRIMRIDWLTQCIRAGKALPHTNYEVSKVRYMESDVVSDSLSRCRKSKERMEPGLFHGCTFYFLARKYEGIDDRHLLRDLIRLGGGVVSSTEPQFQPDAPAPFHASHLTSPLFIVYDVTVTRNIPSVFHRNPTRYNLVSAQWIIESVVEFGLKPIS